MRRFFGQKRNAFLRGIVHKVDASSFETEVMQSQQAVCLVFHIQNTSCNTFIQQVDNLTSEINASSTSSWLKTVSIDGDKNSNLASAFSVERAKLPATYFVLQATIIDKVVGPINEDRMRSVFERFREYYQKQMNLDVTAGMGSSADVIPMSSAPKAALTDNAPTQVLINKLVDSLIGGNCILLPLELEKLDGLRKSIQLTKKQAFKELSDLHKQLGMDTKRLSEDDLIRAYYRSTPYMCAAMITALEALFLSRIFGYVGQLSEASVSEAVSSIQRDFQRTLGDNNMKRLMSVIDVNVVRGQCREALGGALPLWALNGGTGSTADGGLNPNPGTAAAPLGDQERDFFEKILRWCDLADSRIPPTEFPSNQVDEMFVELKRLLPISRRDGAAAKHLSLVKVSVVGVIQMFPDDQKSRAARSRLSSLIY